MDHLCPLAEWTPEQGRVAARSPSGPGAIKDLVLVGVGNFFEGSEEARLQKAQWYLAMALVLRDILQLRGTIMVYDPALTPTERELLKSLDIHYAATFEQTGTFEVVTRTLFWMPYADELELNEILRSNWGPWEMAGVRLIGQSLTRIAMKGQRSTYFVNAIAPFMRETPIPTISLTATDASATSSQPSSRHRYPRFGPASSSASSTTYRRNVLSDDGCNSIAQQCFENLSIHEFPIAFLHQLPAEFWLKPDQTPLNVDWQGLPFNLGSQAASPRFASIPAPIVSSSMPAHANLFGSLPSSTTTMPAYADFVPAATTVPTTVAASPASEDDDNMMQEQQQQQQQQRYQQPFQRQTSGRRGRPRGRGRQR